MLRIVLVLPLASHGWKKLIAAKSILRSPVFLKSLKITLRKGVLIGNKTDLVFRRKVEEDEARNYAEYLGIKYYELSVKDARNLLEPFISLAREYYELYQISANKFKELL
uniref:Signal recognition particle n=1 Tax=Mesocestoides corti TaxID=53468 RepID=A0A5K3FI63_MESCO